MQNRTRSLALVLLLVLVVANGCSFGAQPVVQNVTSTPATVAPTAAAPTEQPGSTTAPPAETVAPTEVVPTDAAPTEVQPTTAATTPAEAATADSTSVAPTTTESVPPRATTPVTATEGLATVESLDSVTLPRRDAVQLALEFKRTTSTERVARTEPLPDKVGDTVTFWVSNVNEDRYYTMTARLELALDHVLMYVDESMEFDAAALEDSARDFNDNIYPRDRELFGEEWSPGIDGDSRITILNTNLPGLLGYFSGSDEIPRSVNRYSNEREMFYMNIDGAELGSPTYSSVLAHEFQHMIEWRQSVRPSTWLNEGFSELAAQLNGFGTSGYSNYYLEEPDTQLTAWSTEPPSQFAHYGAAYLFLSYFYDRYQGQIDLKQLVRDGAGEHLQLLTNDAAEAQPQIRTFGDLYADWAVANLLNDTSLDGGRWSYKELPDTVQPQQDDDGVLTGDVAQWGTDYVEMPATSSERVLRFDGNDEIGVIADDPQGAMWWSDRGDDAVSTLTHSFDLRSVPAATLQFRTWFDIEKDYDYAFASASTDNGATWTTLKGRNTTTDDPQGANYGNGFTSTSGGSTAQWIDESLDLTPYVGKEVLVRFSLITDDAFNLPGMAIDDIRIPEINFSDDVENGANGWQTTGWVRTNNQLDQRWQVRLVTYENDEPQVAAVALDDSNEGEIRVPANTRAVLVVTASTSHTSERASYVVSRP